MTTDLLSRLGCEIHVWMTDPDAITEPQTLATCASMLSEGERQRQARLRFESDRQAFLVSHALVRSALSRYVPVRPAEWQFTTGEHGRPEVVTTAGMPRLRFNLTHTRGLAACVVTLDIACGIDAERIVERPNARAIAGKMFATREISDLERQHGRAFLERFYTYWTLREAYCKARGVGLTRADDGPAFVIEPDGGCHLDGREQGGGEAGAWCFAINRPDTGHILSVAFRSVDGDHRQVVARQIVP